MAYEFKFGGQRSESICNMLNSVDFLCCKSALIITWMSAHFALAQYKFETNAIFMSCALFHPGPNSLDLMILSRLADSKVVKCVGVRSLPLKMSAIKYSFSFDTANTVFLKLEFTKKCQTRRKTVDLANSQVQFEPLIFRALCYLPTTTPLSFALNIKICTPNLLVTARLLIMMV